MIPASPEDQHRRAHPAPLVRPTHLETAVSDAGLDFNVRVHDLRHAHASWLLAGGADIKSSKNASATAACAAPRDGTDTLRGDVLIERDAQRRQVQVAIDAAELLAGLDCQLKH